MTFSRTFFFSGASCEFEVLERMIKEGGLGRGLEVGTRVLGFRELYLDTDQAPTKQRWRQPLKVKQGVND